MASLKLFVILIAAVGSLSASIAFRKSIDATKASGIYEDTDCASCSGESVGVAGMHDRSCTSCTEQFAPTAEFVFEGESPACSACANETSVVTEGEVVPGELSETNVPPDSLALPAIGELTDSTFAERVNATSGVVLVDFYADWCGPCKTQEAILAGYAGGQTYVTILKVNVDENPLLVEKFAIQSIPALKVFREGDLIAEHVGVANVGQLEELLTSTR